MLISKKVHDRDNIEGIKIEQEYGYSVYNIKVDGLESAEYVLNVSNIKSLDSDKKIAVVGGNLKFNNHHKKSIAVDYYTNSFILRKIMQITGK
ncbi:hypothetical protein O6R16_06880 [Candidatus Rickettsia tasmanensis]